MIFLPRALIVILLILLPDNMPECTAKISNALINLALCR